MVDRPIRHDAEGRTSRDGGGLGGRVRRSVVAPEVSARHVGNLLENESVNMHRRQKSGSKSERTGDWVSKLFVSRTYSQSAVSVVPTTSDGKVSVRYPRSVTR